MNHNENKSSLMFGSETVKQLVALIAARWWILALAFVIAVVGTFAILSLKPPSFQSVSAVVLAPPPIRESKSELSELMPKNLKIQDYQIVLNSEPVLYKLMERLKDSGDFDKLPPMEDFQDALNADVRVIKKTSNQLEYSSVILLKAKSSSPKKASQIANTWAEVAIETSENHYKYGISGMKEFLDAEIMNVAEDYESKIKDSADQLEILLQNLNKSKKQKIEELNVLRDEKEKKISELQKKLNLDYMRDELSNYREIVSENRKQLEDVIIQKEAQQQEVAALEKERKQTPQKIVLNKGLTDTAMAMMSSQKGEISEDLKNKTIVAEEKNEVYYMISEQLSEARALLENLRTQEKTLQKKIAEFEKKYKNLYSEIQDAEYDLNELKRRLNAEEEILQEELNEKVEKSRMLGQWTSKKLGEEIEGQRKILNSMIQKYISSQLAEAGTTPDLKVLSRATPPNQALPRGRAVKSLSIGVIALIFVFLLLLVIEVFKSET